MADKNKISDRFFINARILDFSAKGWLIFRQKKINIVFLCLILTQSILIGSLPVYANRAEFSYSINSDPDSLDPIKSSSSISSYLLNTLYAPLMSYQGQILKPMGAKSCVVKSNRLVRCELRKDWLWSDGKPITAEQFVNNWRYMNETKSPRLNQFRGIDKVVAFKKNNLDFHLTKPDAEFLYRLIDPAMSPRREDIEVAVGSVTTGPYFVKKHEKGKYFSLEPNVHFFINPDKKPMIKVLIVDSDNTALSLFETQKLNFLRRLTTENIPIYKNHPGFRNVPLHRMDYIGLNTEVAAYPGLKENLVYAIEPQFAVFQKLFAALGPPGCMSVVTQELRSPVCYKPRAVTPYSDEEVKKLPKLKLQYAGQGGEDIRRAMELFHNGWKKNLNIDIELQPSEWGVMNQTLKTAPPPLFRRGVPLERPTCLAALEVFESTGDDNFVKLNSTKLDGIIEKMRRLTKPSPKLCSEGLQTLLETHRIIPLGQIHFTMLSDNKFDGILINELNQLDLTQLQQK